jgi:hypothetical protein
VGEAYFIPFDIGATLKFFLIRSRFGFGVLTVMRSGCFGRSHHLV